MRDNTWLFQKLDELWDEYFSDIQQNNGVAIKFGRRARQRLGSIKQEPKSIRDISDKSRKTIIIINGLFKDPGVPEYVVTATIAHELCHYAHGFSSPLEQSFLHPHYGGVVTKELKVRGFEKELKLQKKWLKEVWPEYLKEKMPANRAQRRSRRKVLIKWI